MQKPGQKLKYRERIFRIIFLAGDAYRVFTAWLNGFCRFFFTITLSLFILLFIYYIGFSYSPETSSRLIQAFRITFLVLFFSKYIPEILNFNRGRSLTLIIRILIFLFALLVFATNFISVAEGWNKFWKLFYGATPIIITILLIGISELSKLARIITTVKIPPALIFSFSFLFIILIGSGLLFLPNAHTEPISYIDSLFTSVSAVCVTGLTVVNTSSAFSTLGQVIILCLIQVGGLGIMTFTGFFSYIFSSTSSFRDKLFLKEIFSAESLNNLFRLLAKILFLTFITEIAGAFLIYISLEWQMENRLLFSVFHAVSGFCNAGFSTMPDGLFSETIRYCYPVHIYIATLVILGGIGFPVLLSLYSYLKWLIVILVRKVRYKNIPLGPQKRNMSVRLVLFTTFVLIVTGTGLYYFFESETSLSGLNETKKILVSFFGSVSARTAGFNIIDITKWSYPTVFLMMLLMWIGASPGSTGGGIKTTTFALALRTVWMNIRGREQMVIGNREVGNMILLRIFSIIFLSIIIIITGFFCLLIFEPGHNPVHLLFESVSAFGTVGLSLANTSTFSNAGKIVIMFIMFIGRVGPLTLLTGILLTHRHGYSRYPEADLVIN